MTSRLRVTITRRRVATRPAMSAPIRRPRSTSILGLPNRSAVRIPIALAVSIIVRTERALSWTGVEDIDRNSANVHSGMRGARSLSGGVLPRWPATFSCPLSCCSRRAARAGGGADLPRRSSPVMLTTPSVPI